MTRGSGDRLEAVRFLQAVLDWLQDYYQSEWWPMNLEKILKPHPVLGLFGS
jgi:hypothetical protein